MAIKNKGYRVPIYNWVRLAQESFKSPNITLIGEDLTNSRFVYSLRKRQGGIIECIDGIIVEDRVVLPEFNVPIGVYEHELLWINESTKRVVFQGSLKITGRGELISFNDTLTFEIVTENNTIDVVIEGKGDRGENGWTPCFLFEKFGGKIVKKLIDYDLGTGVKPTLHINEYVAENGYTNNIENALNFKGDKGDSFTYEDFTPEQIQDLKQPAIDAATLANEATNNANQATANANNATEQANEATLSANQSAQNANDKAQLAEDATLLATEATEQANTATNNANNATNNAISATNEANQATANAINATNEANQATANANNAANFANAQRGWSPCFIFENDGATRVVKKLADWIGGTGAKPTDNVGQYVLDGGYTSDKSLATNFKGEQSDNLIAEYVHSGNKEVYITSIDYETYTFYAPNHGLSNSVNINSAVGFVFVNSDLEIQANVLPLPTTSVLYVVNSTTDTFQLSNSVGGAPLTLLNESALDVSKFRIELTSLPDISFTNTGLSKSIKISIEGKGVRDTNSQYLNARDRGVNILASSATANYQGAASRILPFRNSLFGYLDVDLINYSDFTVIKQKMKVVKSNGSSFSVESTERESISKPVMNLNNITFRSLPVANGAIIRLYK